MFCSFLLLYDFVYWKCTSQHYNQIIYQNDICRWILICKRNLPQLFHFHFLIDNLIGNHYKHTRYEYIILQSGQYQIVVTYKLHMKFYLLNMTTRVKITLHVIMMFESNVFFLIGSVWPRCKQMSTLSAFDTRLLTPTVQTMRYGLCCYVENKDTGVKQNTIRFYLNRFEPDFVFQTPAQHCIAIDRSIGYHQMVFLYASSCLMIN